MPWVDVDNKDGKWVDVDQVQDLPEKSRLPYKISEEDYFKPEITQDQKDALAAGSLATLNNAADFARGGEKILNEVVNKLPGERDYAFRPTSDIRENKEKWDKKLIPYKDKYPVATTLMPIASEMPFGSANALKSMAIGAGMEGARFSDNQLMNAGIAGAGSMVMNALSRKAMRYLNRNQIDPKYDMDPDRVGRLETLDDLNYTKDLTPSQLSGSTGGASYENRLRASPGTSWWLQGKDEATEALYNKNVAKHFGSTANKINEVEAAKLNKRFGDEFNRLKNMTGDFNVDTSYVYNVSKLSSDLDKFPDSLNKVNKQIKQISRAMPDGMSDMKYITDKSSELKSLARATDNTQTKFGYNSLADELDGLAERQLSSGDYKDLKKVRQLYKESLALEKSRNVETGFIDAQKMATNLRANDKIGYGAATNNPLYEETKAYNAIVGKAKDRDAMGSSNVLDNLGLAAAYMLGAEKARKTAAAFRYPKVLPLENEAAYLGGILGRGGFDRE